MHRTPKGRLASVALVVLVVSSLVGIGVIQTSASISTNDCERDDCERDDERGPIERSIAMMLERFGWETGHIQETNTDTETETETMTASQTVMTMETQEGEIHVAGDVAPGETVTITLTDGLADADVRVNGEPVAPTDADGEIEIVVPEDGEVTIVVEVEQADHEIYLAGDETGTEVRSSTSSSGSGSSTSTSTSTSTSSSTSTTSTSTSTSSSTATSSTSTSIST